MDAPVEGVKIQMVVKADPLLVHPGRLDSTHGDETSNIESLGRTLKINNFLLLHHAHFLTKILHVCLTQLTKSGSGVPGRKNGPQMARQKGYPGAQERTQVIPLREPMAAQRVDRANTNEDQT